MRQPKYYFECGCGRQFSNAKALELHCLGDRHAKENGSYTVLGTVKVATRTFGQVYMREPTFPTSR